MRKRLLVLALAAALVASILLPTAAFAYRVGVGNALGNDCKVIFYSGSSTGWKWVFGSYLWPYNYSSPGQTGVKKVVGVYGASYMYDYSPEPLYANGTVYGFFNDWKY